MGTTDNTKKLFTTSSWSLFEDLLKTRLSGIKGELAELQLKVKKPAAAVAADSLATAQTIDGVSFDGSSSVSHYGICNTAAATATKTVSCAGFTLVNGAEITVRFDVANTSTDPLYLKVGDTDAKLIKYHGVSVTGNEIIKEDYTYTFKYNGSWFEIVGTVGDIYGVFTTANAVAAGEPGLVPAPAAGNLNGTYLESNGSWSVPANTTYSEFVPATNDSAGTGGLVPAPLVGDGANKFLSANGTWAVPAGATTAFSGASASDAGSAGLVPAPAANDQNKFLKADGTWAVPLDSDTTYNDFTGATNAADGAHGLVPAPETGDETKFLKGDGTWSALPSSSINNFTGSTSSANGAAGLVPAPTSGDEDDKFLKADGTWSVPAGVTAVFTGTNGSTAGTGGLVPAPDTTDANKYLKSDGTWAAIAGGGSGGTYVPFVPATSSADGTEGLVPAPETGDDDSKFLNADGAWSIPPVATHISDGYMSSGDKINLDNFYHQTNKAYSVGEQVHVPGQPNYLVLECIQAGVTAAVAPDFDESGYDYYQTNTAYDVGDQVRVEGQPSYLVLECQTAGTSGAVAPNFN